MNIYTVLEIVFLGVITAVMLWTFVLKPMMGHARLPHHYLNSGAAGPIMQSVWDEQTAPRGQIVRRQHHARPPHPYLNSGAAAAKLNSLW